MIYKLKKLFFKTAIIIIMVTILFPSLNYQYGQVFGFHDASDNDRKGGIRTFRVPDAGDAVKIPEEIVQSTDDAEGYNQNWSTSTKQYELYKVWKEQGGKATENHWAYLEISGTPRYIVALAPIFGQVGDYVDIYITNNGQEKIYPCIIGDSKDVWVDAAYTYNGKAYGHQGANGTCKIIEPCSELLLNSSNVSLIVPLLNKLKNITQIANGGNYFEHPDGPIGLDGSYTYEDGSEGSDDGSEAGTFVGAVGSLLRTGWATLNSLFDNYVEKREDITVLYDFRNTDSSGMGNGDVLAACEEVTKILLDRGCSYSLTDLIWGDINSQFNSSNRFCCASYVSSVLYYSGALTAEQINAYNYQWTGAGGVPDMLAAAGWYQVDPSEAQPGDVVNKYEIHVMIYAGNGQVWDQRSCVTSSNGDPPTATTRPYDISNCQIWRRGS